MKGNASHPYAVHGKNKVENSITVGALFDLGYTIASDIFDGCVYPWEALPKIKEFILTKGAGLSPDEYDNPSPGVWIAKDAKIAPTASISGPCIICSGAEVRHCAFIRTSAIVGRGAVVGNSTELKNVILFDGVQVPHYNYVGDSILGHRAHMGAGSIASNVRSDKKNISVHAPDGDIPTGLRKFGVILGDDVEVGCGSVLNPGTVVGRGARVYPLSCVRGCVPGGCIYKRAGEIAEIREI